MSGHILMFSGSYLGITPDMSIQEVWSILKNHGLTGGMALMSWEIVVFIDYKNYYVKDRHHGRCDFKSDTALEKLVFGD